MNSMITQVLATILILMSVTKLVVVLWHPRAWIGFAKRLYAKPAVTSAVALFAAVILLSLLIRSGLDIVEILAVCLFVVSLLVVGIAPYAPQLFAWFEAEDLGRLVKRQWLYVLAWMLLLAWGLYTLAT